MYTLLSTSLYTCLWPNLPCYIEWGVWGFCGNLKIGEHNTIWAGQSNSRWDFGGVSFCVFHRRVCTVLPHTHSASKCGISEICLRVKIVVFVKRNLFESLLQYFSVLRALCPSINEFGHEHVWFFFLVFSNTILLS